MRRLDLTGPPPKDGRKHPEKIFLLVTRGSKENWGELSPLRGSSWENGVQVISGEAFSHALHGFFPPLQKELGREAQASARRVIPKEGECSQRGNCIKWHPELCRPGGRLKKEIGPPDCYEPPVETQDPALRKLFTEVTLAWKENRYTIVVTGEGEFNLK